MKTEQLYPVHPLILLCFSSCKLTDVSFQRERALNNFQKIYVLVSIIEHCPDYVIAYLNLSCALGLPTQTHQGQEYL